MNPENTAISMPIIQWHRPRKPYEGFTLLGEHFGDALILVNDDQITVNSLDFFGKSHPIWLSLNGSYVIIGCNARKQICQPYLFELYPKVDMALARVAASWFIYHSLVAESICQQANIPPIPFMHNGHEYHAYLVDFKDSLISCERKFLSIQMNDHDSSLINSILEFLNDSTYHLFPQKK